MYAHASKPSFHLSLHLFHSICPPKKDDGHHFHRDFTIFHRRKLLPPPETAFSLAAVRGQGVDHQQQRQQLRAALEALRQQPGAERRAQSLPQGGRGVEHGGPGGFCWDGGI